MRLTTLFMAVLLVPVAAAAQSPAWTIEITAGSAGLVDDAIQWFVSAGAGARRSLTSRLSIGPEIVVMTGGSGTRDRHVVLTANLTFDLVAPGAQRRVVPYVVGGGGVFWARDRVAQGTAWGADPAFTAGGGVRVRMSDAVSLLGDYRLGWELHQRISAGAALGW